MAWNNNSGGPWGGGGGGGNGGGPWGGGGNRGGGGGGPFGRRPPDMDDMIRRGQERLRNLMPGGLGSFKGIVLIALLKGRVLHATIGFFFVPIAIYATCRIGKPHSPWARHRYGDRRPKKQAKAEDRFAPTRRTERFKEAFRDVVGGKPEQGVTAARDEAIAATREATAEVRERAERFTHKD